MDGVENIRLRADGDGTRLAVKVVPGASRDRVVGVLGDRVKIATSAAAEKGRANTAVIRTLASALGLDRRDVVLIVGRTSPGKEFLIRSLPADELRRRLAGL